MVCRKMRTLGAPLSPRVFPMFGLDSSRVRPNGMCAKPAKPLVCAPSTNAWILARRNSPPRRLTCIPPMKTRALAETSKMKPVCLTAKKWSFSAADRTVSGKGLSLIIAVATRLTPWLNSILNPSWSIVTPKLFRRITTHQIVFISNR